MTCRSAAPASPLWSLPGTILPGFGVAWLAALLLAQPALPAAAEEGAPVVEQGVVYGTAEGVKLLLDLARPAAPAKACPALVFIHGGGWTAGTRSQYAGAIVEAARHGYVAATIDYRFAPAFRFPAQVEDAQCAVRWLRAHAAELHLDPQRVGAVGDSAGGHLALMLGLMDPADGLAGTGGNPDQKAKVQVVVNFYGPGDFTHLGALSGEATRLLVGFLGTVDPAQPIARRASPIAYIDAKDAPVLTLHGAADTLVPVAQGQRLHEALRAAKVEEHLEIIPGAGHGFGGAAAEHAWALTREFLDRHLHP